MSQPDLERFIRRAFAAKIEVTEDTDIVPDGTGADGILLMNGAFSTEFDKITRQIDRSYFTNDPISVANKRSVMQGDFELFAPSAPGVGASANDVLLLTAGLTKVLNAGAKTTQYNPVSTGVGSATWYGYHADTFYKSTGTRCDISSIKMEIGQRFMGKVKTLGNYSVISETSMPSMNLYTTVPVVCTHDVSEAYVTNPAGGSDLLVWAKSLEVIFGNKLASKEYTTIKKNTISDRKATWNMRIAKTALADFNPWTVRDAGTIITARMRTYETGNYGVRNGLYSELMIRGQIDTITEANIDDDLGWDLSGPCIASNSGGDEFDILFGDDTFTITGSYTGGVHGAVSFTPGLAGRHTGSTVWTAVGLPSGVTINSSTGAFGGTSIAGGPTPVTVTATDSSVPIAQVATKVFTLTYT